MTFKLLPFILVITFFGAFLRFYKISENPVSLTVDEVSIGYNAYSILKTGQDEYGNWFPLIFKSLGDYKPPLYIYLTTIPIALFGLSEFSVRFISALFGTLSIPVSFLLIWEITKNRKYAVIASIIFTVSPWHVYFSRFGSESLTALFFVMIGIFFLLRVLKGNMVYAFLAAFFLVASMFTYHAERIFVPLFVFSFVTFNLKALLQKRRNAVALIVSFGVLLLPMIYSVIFGSDTTRAQMTIISNDVEFLRGVVLDSFGKNILDPFLLFFYGIRKYLAYFQPSFLFYNGLGMTKQGTYGMGVMYFFEIPLLIFGIISIARRKIPNTYLILLWIFLGIFPASLTLNEQHPIRTLVILPMVVLILAIGTVEMFNNIRNRFSFTLRILVLSFFCLIVLWNLINATIIYSVHFPKEKGEGLMEGTKQAIEYALLNQDKYKEIIFDPVRGTEGPYLVNAPHAYILFYSKYDPNIYHNTIKREGNNLYGFDKFTIRPIKWISDSNKKDTLFIGSQWSMPKSQLTEDEILKKIYLSSGKEALLIVSPGKKD